jgi:NHL repeat
MGAVSTFVVTPGVSGSANGTGLAARFYGPAGLAVDSSGTVYVVDQIDATIGKATLNGLVTTLAGSPGLTGSADGFWSAARFNVPVGIAVDVSGNLYIGDQANHAIRNITLVAR